MEDTVIVIMQKDKETGFLDKELGCYALGDGDAFVLNTYAEETEQGDCIVFLKLTCEREVSDWEYNAILDYYDTETVGSLVDTIAEDTEEYNPVWIVSFPFVEEQTAMEEKLQNILQAHRQELYSVYDTITEKEAEYT